MDSKDLSPEESLLVAVVAKDRAQQQVDRFTDGNNRLRDRYENAFLVLHQSVADGRVAEAANFAQQMVDDLTDPNGGRSVITIMEGAGTQIESVKRVEAERARIRRRKRKELGRKADVYLDLYDIQILDIQIEGISLRDIFERELGQEEIERFFLAVRTEAASSLEGRRRTTTHTLKFGSMFLPLISANLVDLDESELSTPVQYWIRNTRVFYGMLRDQLARGERINEALVSYYGHETELNRMFATLTALHLSDGGSAFDIFDFAADTSDAVYDAAVVGTYQGHKNELGYNFDPIRKNSLENDQMYEANLPDMEYLQLIADELRAECLEREGEVSDIARPVKQIEIDTSGFLFAQRMGIDAVEFRFSKDDPNSIQTVLIYRSGFRVLSNFELDYYIDPGSIRALARDHMAVGEIRSFYEREILLRTLLLEYLNMDMSIKERRKRKNKKMNAQEMMFASAARYGIDREQIQLEEVEDHGEIDYIDPVTGEVHHFHLGIGGSIPRGWYSPRVIQTNAGYLRRMLPGGFDKEGRIDPEWSGILKFMEEFDQLSSDGSLDPRFMLFKIDKYRYLHRTHYHRLHQISPLLLAEFFVLNSV